MDLKHGEYFVVPLGHHEVTVVREDDYVLWENAKIKEMLQAFKERTDANQQKQQAAGAYKPGQQVCKTSGSL